MSSVTKLRAGVVALVAEDAVELERVADRLVDLQDHLVGRDDQIHRAGRAVRRRQQLQCLRRQARRGVEEADGGQDLQSALATERVPAEGACLRLGAGVGGGAERRQQELKALADAAAGAGHEQGVEPGVPEAGLPVDDACVAVQAFGLAAQQVDLVGQRRARPSGLDPRGILARPHLRLPAGRAEQVPPRGAAAPTRSACSAARRRPAVVRSEVPA